MICATEIWERQKELLVNTLNWWEEHQFDCDGVRNRYDDEPDFVTNAKEIWIRSMGQENPHDWIWLRLDEI